MIDFEKCFDRVDYRSIEKAFKYFGFGDSFVSMLFLLFNELELCTINSGYISNFFHKKRGVNQGCCASPLVYTVCGEIMAHMIINNVDIKGIDLHGIKNVLAQFADDTGAFLKYESLTLNTFINVLTSVEANMGLKVSYDKTTIYRVGSLYGTNAKLYTQKEFRWAEHGEPINTLGVKLLCDGGISPENYEEILIKVRNTCENWYNRTLTLTGKILVFNVLMGSLFVYKTMAMLTLTKEEIKNVEDLCRKFIWNGKKPKISLYTLQRMREHGGLRLIDIQARQDTIRIGWIFKLEKDPLIAACAYNDLKIPELGSLIWECNIKQEDVKNEYKTNMNSFWVQTLLSWSKINFREPSTGEEVKYQIIWRNSLIKIRRKTVYFVHWLEQNIIFVGDLFDVDGEYKSLANLGMDEKYWLEFNSLKAAIPHGWLFLLKNDQTHGKETLYRDLMKMTKINRRVYDILIFDDMNVNKYLEQWHARGVMILHERYYRAFINLKKSTKIVKYHDFQYRLLLNKVFTNDTLFKWGIKSSEACSFCGEYVEDIVHLLFQCKFVNGIWSALFSICEFNEIQYNSHIVYLVENCTNDNPTHIINFVTLFIKQYIYSCKCGNKTPSVEGVLVSLQKLQNVEYANAKTENTLVKHKKKWSPIFSFL